MAKHEPEKQEELDAAREWLIERHKEQQNSLVGWATLKFKLRSGHLSYPFPGISLGLVKFDLLNLGYIEYVGKTPEAFTRLTDKGRSFISFQKERKANKYADKGIFTKSVRGDSETKEIAQSGENKDNLPESSSNNTEVKPLGKGGLPLIFVSYSRDDYDVALKIANDLKTAGLNIWLDTLELLPGVRWALEVEKALDKCEIFLVLLSQASIKSENVENEIHAAIEERKRIVPIVIVDCKIPLRLRSLQRIDFTKGYEGGIAKLCDALNVNK